MLTQLWKPLTRYSITFFKKRIVDFKSISTYHRDRNSFPPFDGLVPFCDFLFRLRRAVILTAVHTIPLKVWSGKIINYDSQTSPLSVGSFSFSSKKKTRWKIEKKGVFFFRVFKIPSAFPSSLYRYSCISRSLVGSK